MPDNDNSISVDELVAAFAVPAPRRSSSGPKKNVAATKQQSDKSGNDKSKSSDSKDHSKKESKPKSSKKKSAKSASKHTSKKAAKAEETSKPRIRSHARDVNEEDLLSALGIQFIEDEPAKSETGADQAYEPSAPVIKKAFPAPTGQTIQSGAQNIDAPTGQLIAYSEAQAIQQSAPSAIQNLQTSIDSLEQIRPDVQTQQSAVSYAGFSQASEGSPNEFGASTDAVVKKQGFSTLNFDRRVSGVMSEATLDPQHYIPASEISSVVTKKPFGSFSTADSGLSIQRLSDGQAVSVTTGQLAGDTIAQEFSADATAISVPAEPAQIAEQTQEVQMIEPLSGFTTDNAGLASQTGMQPTSQVVQAASTAGMQMPQPTSSQPALSGAIAPAQTDSFTQQMPPQGVAQPQSAGQPIKPEEGTSKKTIVLGTILIVFALVCAALALALITGLLNFNALIGNTGTTSSHNTTQSQVANVSNGNADELPESNVDVEPEIDPAMQGNNTVVYSYVVRGLDGTAHEATETAVFNSDGILVESTIEINVDNQEIADDLLEQLKTEFGDSVKDSEATDSHVLIVLEIGRNDLTREAYTELLAANMVEFSVVD